MQKVRVTLALKGRNLSASNVLGIVIRFIFDGLQPSLMDNALSGLVMVICLLFDGLHR